MDLLELALEAEDRQRAPAAAARGEHYLRKVYERLREGDPSPPTRQGSP